MHLIKEWGHLFGAHNRMTLVHIPLHALHKYLYLDVLHAPERLDREITMLQQSSAKPYIDAWDYVNARDYNEIIEQLRALYR